MDSLVVVGGGGHAGVVIEAVRAHGGFDPVAVVDASADAGDGILGVPVAGDDSALPGLLADGVRFAHVAVGSVGDASRRRELADRLGQMGFELAAIVHPSAVVASSATLGAGTFVGPLAAVNAGSTLGRCCIVNTGSIVEHDCELGDFVHVAPGAVVNGDARIGSDTHIGSGAVVRNGLCVGAGTLIGAGSVVVDDIGAGTVAYGVPCREVRRQP